MKRRLAIRIIGVAGVVSVLLSLLVFAANDDFTIRNDVRLVLLDVSVENHAGNFVPGISKQNFTVLENGQPQVISVFDGEDAPVTMGLIVDESASMTPRRGQVVVAAGYLIAESNPQDQLFVLNFNDSVKRGLPDGVPFSGNIQELRAALNRETPRGQTALYDAVADGLKQLEAGNRGRKTLVLISDGGDNASLHKRAETIQLVERSAATIFTIGLFEEGAYDADPGILKELAKISGGEAFFPMNADGLADACHRIAKEIRTRYTIGYIPGDNKNSAPLRHIHVKVSMPGQSGLKVLTRSSYLYDEPEAKNVKPEDKNGK
jgi:Ca-activated chloride channel family protein